MSNLIKTVGRTGNAGSLVFDGVNDYISLASNNTFTNKISISVFINILSYQNSFLGLLGDWNKVENKRQFVLMKDNTFNNIYQFYISSNGKNFYFVQTTTKLRLNKWYHICATYDGATMKIYVDSSLEKSTTISINLYNLANQHTIGSYDNSNFYNINISNYKLYNRDLQLNEIKLLSQGLPISRTGLVGEWKMNEMSGTTAYDTSGNGNHGTIVGATYSTEKPF